MIESTVSSSISSSISSSSTSMATEIETVEMHTENIIEEDVFQLTNVSIMDTSMLDPMDSEENENSISLDVSHMEVEDTHLEPSELVQNSQENNYQPILNPPTLNPPTLNPSTLNPSNSPTLNILQEINHTNLIENKLNKNQIQTITIPSTTEQIQHFEKENFFNSNPLNQSNQTQHSNPNLDSNLNQNFDLNLNQNSNQNHLNQGISTFQEDGSKYFKSFDGDMKQQTLNLQEYLLNKTFQFYVTQTNSTQEEISTRKSFQDLQSHRRNVLKYLEDELIKFFTNHVEPLKNCSGDECCRLLVFGSCRLGVENWNSDIDVVAAVPQSITKDIFFVKLREFLEMNPNVSYFNAVTDAFVPVIRFTFYDVPIDLLYAPINVQKFGKDFDPLNDEYFKSVDDATKRALNGPRVADDILTLVPDENVFRLTLQCVKLWARRRGIYSNSFGYLGGIAWTLLVANICRLFPNDSPTRLLRRFFHVYRYWKWPSPVILKDIDFEENGVRVWNPNRYTNDRMQLMPIITPSYPSMNSSFNVNKTSLRLITEEFIRGDSILNRVPTLDHISNTVFDELFEENNFFIRYKNYLQLEVSADTPDEHRIWEAFIESRLRFLVLALEMMDSLLVHPYPHSFSTPEFYSKKSSSLFYIGLKYIKQEKIQVDNSIDILSVKSSNDNSSSLENSTENIKKPRVDLTRAAATFEMKLNEWDKRSNGMHMPKLTLVKRYQIPEFVCSKEKKKFFFQERKRKFEEFGEYKAQSSLKRAKQSTTPISEPQTNVFEQVIA